MGKYTNSAKKSGLSGAINVSYGARNRRTPQNNIFRVNKSAQQREKERRSRLDYAARELYPLLFRWLFF